MRAAVTRSHVADSPLNSTISTLPLQPGLLRLSFNYIFETWMISRPFYIEDAPEFVYLTILIGSPAAGIHSQ